MFFNNQILPLGMSYRASLRMSFSSVSTSGPIPHQWQDSGLVQLARAGVQALAVGEEGGPCTPSPKNGWRQPLGILWL